VTPYFNSIIFLYFPSLVTHVCIHKMTTTDLLFSASSAIHFLLSVIALFWWSENTTSILAVMVFGCFFLPAVTIAHNQSSNLKTVTIWILSCIVAFTGGYGISLLPYDPHQLIAFTHGIVIPPFVIGVVRVFYEPN
jgi:hypothetical protein